MQKADTDIPSAACLNQEIVKVILPILLVDEEGTPPQYET